MVERYLDLPEKTALLLLSLAFIASLIGNSVGKGLISMALGLFAAMIATGEDFYPRLTMGQSSLSEGIPIAAAILGVLIVGEVFKALEDIYRSGSTTQKLANIKDSNIKISVADWRKYFPYRPFCDYWHSDWRLAGCWVHACGNFGVFLCKAQIYGKKKCRCA